MRGPRGGVTRRAGSGARRAEPALLAPRCPALRGPRCPASAQPALRGLGHACLLAPASRAPGPRGCPGTGHGQCPQASVGVSAAGGFGGHGAVASPPSRTFLPHHCPGKREQALPHRLRQAALLQGRHWGSGPPTTPLLPALGLRLVAGPGRACGDRGLPRGAPAGGSCAGTAGPFPAACPGSSPRARSPAHAPVSSAPARPRAPWPRLPGRGAGCPMVPRRKSHGEPHRCSLAPLSAWPRLMQAAHLQPALRSEWDPLAHGGGKEQVWELFEGKVGLSVAAVCVRCSPPVTLRNTASPRRGGRGCLGSGTSVRPETARAPRSRGHRAGWGGLAWAEAAPAWGRHAVSLPGGCGRQGRPPVHSPTRLPRSGLCTAPSATPPGATG